MSLELLIDWIVIIRSNYGIEMACRDDAVRFANKTCAPVTRRDRLCFIDMSINHDDPRDIVINGRICWNCILVHRSKLNELKQNSCPGINVK